MKKKKAPPCAVCNQYSWEWYGLNIEAGIDTKGVADMYRCKTCGNIITDDFVIYDEDFHDATNEFVNKVKSMKRGK